MCFVRYSAWYVKVTAKKNDLINPTEKYQIMNVLNISKAVVCFRDRFSLFVFVLKQVAMKTVLIVLRFFASAHFIFLCICKDNLVASSKTIV